jgi:hypothetical protein
LVLYWSDRGGALALTPSSKKENLSPLGLANASMLSSKLFLVEVGRNPAFPLSTPGGVGSFWDASKLAP